MGQEVRREKKNLSFLYFLFASALLSLSLSLSPSNNSNKTVNWFESPADSMTGGWGASSVRGQGWIENQEK